MRFLIDEDLPRSTGDLLMQYGHDAIDVRDIGLRGFKDSEVAAYAQEGHSFYLLHLRMSSPHQSDSQVKGRNTIFCVRFTLDTQGEISYSPNLKNELLSQSQISVEILAGIAPERRCSRIKRAGA
jgi:hypothetical protein